MVDFTRRSGMAPSPCHARVPPSQINLQSLLFDDFVLRGKLRVEGKSINGGWRVREMLLFFLAPSCVARRTEAALLLPADVRHGSGRDGRHAVDHGHLWNGSVLGQQGAAGIGNSHSPWRAA
jgi:hypothetical protein